MNPVPLPPPLRGGHYKAPLCCERLMKGMLRGVLFFPPEQGWQGNTIRKGAKQPENRVTRFPMDAQRT